MSVTGITYLQENGQYYKVDGNGNRNQIDKAEYDRGIFAAKNNTVTQVTPGQTDAIATLNAQQATRSKAPVNNIPAATTGETSTTVTVQNEIDPALDTLLKSLSVKERATLAEIIPELGEGIPLAKCELTEEQVTKLQQFLNDRQANQPYSRIQLEDPETLAEFQKEGILAPDATPDENGIYSIADVEKFKTFIAKDENREKYQMGTPEADPENNKSYEIKSTITTETTTQGANFKKVDSKYLDRIKPEQLYSMVKQGLITKVGKDYYVDANSSAANSIPSTNDGQLLDVSEYDFDKKGDIKKFNNDARVRYLNVFANDPQATQKELLGTKYRANVDENMKLITNSFHDPRKDVDYNGDSKVRPFDLTLNTQNYYKAVASDSERKDYLNSIAQNYLKLSDSTLDADKVIEEAKTAINQELKEQGADREASFEEIINTIATQHPAKGTSDPKLVKEFNAAFGQSAKELDAGQLAALAFFQTNEEKSIANDENKKRALAEHMVTNRFEIKAADLATQLQAGKISESKFEKELAKIQEQKAAAQLEDRKDYAELMSDGYTKFQVGKHKVDNTHVEGHYDQATLYKDKDMKAFIEGNKHLFFVNGEFSPAKWKEFVLDMGSSDGVKDYVFSLGEAEKISSKGDSNATNGFKSLKDLGIGKNDNGRINIARKMAESIGLPTEDNNTHGLRWKKGAEKFGLGVLAGGATATVGEAYKSLSSASWASVGKFMLNGVEHMSPQQIIHDNRDVVTSTAKYYENGTLIGQQKAYINVGDKFEDNVSGVKETGTVNMGFNPMAILYRAGIVGAANVIAGIGDIKKTHDKEDKKSRVAEYAVRAFDRKPKSTTESSSNSHHLNVNGVQNTLTVTRKTKTEGTPACYRKLIAKGNKAERFADVVRRAYSEMTDAEWAKYGAQVRQQVRLFNGLTASGLDEKGQLITPHTKNPDGNIETDGYYFPPTIKIGDLEWGWKYPDEKLFDKEPGRGTSVSRNVDQKQGTPGTETTTTSQHRVKQRKI